MIIRIKPTITDDWENIEIDSVTLKMGDCLTGVIKASPLDRAGEVLNSKSSMDFEFSRDSDDGDATVISVSGMHIVSCEIGSGDGYELPIDVYEYTAEEFDIID